MEVICPCNNCLPELDDLHMVWVCGSSGSTIRKVERTDLVDCGDDGICEAEELFTVEEWARVE